MATVILIYGAWWQYQLVQNLQPVEPQNAPDSGEQKPITPLPENHTLLIDDESSENLPADLQAAIQTQQRSERETQKYLALVPEPRIPLPPLWVTSENYSADGIIPITFHRATLQSLRLGDTLPLPTINGQQLDATITEKSTSSRNNLTLKATISAWSETYPVIITQGKTHTFATIATPQGIYELEAKGSAGTLRSSLVFNKLIDPEKPDTLEAPIF